MFVRFRKLPNGGFHPVGARGEAATILCRGQHCYRDKGGRCWLWPRCRWVMVIDDEGKHLVPYRIKVELVANGRVAGKVKQEIIAVLGSIDAAILESFWATAPQPELRTEKWEYYSLRWRTAFWQDALDRISKIGDNRLSKDDRVSICRAIHKVVPWVTEPERKRLVLLEARNTYENAKSMHELYEGNAAHDGEMIELFTQHLKNDEKESAELAARVLQAGLNIANVAGS